MKVVDEQAPSIREQSDRTMTERILNWRNFMVVGETISTCQESGVFAIPLTIGLQLSEINAVPGWRPGPDDASVVAMTRTLLLAGSLMLSLPLNAGGFSQRLEENGITYTITSPNRADGNTVTITPKGLKGSNAPITKPVDGLVTKAEVADLNGDDAPELFLYTTSPGSGSYGKAYAWATNGKKSLTEIFITPPQEKDLSGYMGHDELAVIENSFARRFPVYKPGDANSSPSGGWRQFQYKLKAGEAGWVLRIKRVDSF